MNKQYLNQSHSPHSHQSSPQSMSYSQPKEIPQPSQINYNPIQKQPGPMIKPQPNEIPPSIETSDRINVNYLFSKVPNPELEDEFDLINLGIDLETSEPLMPSVYYLGSDAPMVHHAQYPIPRSYPKDLDVGDPFQKMKYFSDECLLFLFYLNARDELQYEAAEELKRRGLVFVPKYNYWKNQKELVFDHRRWKFVQPDENGLIPIVQ